MITIIAEVGSVHDGSHGNAQKLIEAAAASGADVVKFQTHIAEAETLADAPSPGYFTAEPRFTYFERTSFSLSKWQELANHCRKCGVGFMSSPFSIEAVALLEDVGVESYKVPSGEVTNVPLLERIGATGKPTYLSSGMSDWTELDRAVATLKGSVPLTVLQCSSVYPCPPESVGLNVLLELRQRYGVPVGLSDHTLGFSAAIAAAALGATAIEKHFTFSRLMYGSDAKHSMEPAELTLLCKGLREVEAMLATPVDKNDVQPYADMKRIFEKSIVTVRGVAKDETLTMANLAFKKPGDGISASRVLEIVGRRTRRALSPGTQLAEDDLA